MPEATLVWFRLDLRLADNPALIAAVEKGAPIIPVFIWSPEGEGHWRPGAASRWWLHKSLTQLEASLRERGSRLIIRREPTVPAFQELIAETHASEVFWNRRYEPAAIVRDSNVKKALIQSGINAESFNGSLLFEPWQVKTRDGNPFKVFSAFWRACMAAAEPEAPESTPGRIVSPKHWPESLSIEDLKLEPTIGWMSGLESSWQPGEEGASRQLQCFLDETISNYHHDRDRPDLVGTSRLSPHLHFGEIGLRQVWSAVHRRLHGRSESGEHFLRELGWREFAHHLLYHFPQTPDVPLRENFARFPWVKDPSKLRRWQRGTTGYPIVDAGMRELWHTGWMHNRVRMVTASFLVKDLLIPWQQGAEWFWDTLVDADLANNTLGWQWTAGCGADAAPYFRIFNPVSQGEKFDPNGEYVRRWVPEVSKLPNNYIQQPWLAPKEVLDSAGIELGKTYPLPIVDHHKARARALEAFEEIKG